jgi:hypothetical protein
MATGDEEQDDAARDLQGRSSHVKDLQHELARQNEQQDDARRRHPQRHLASEGEVGFRCERRINNHPLQRAGRN